MFLRIVFSQFFITKLQVSRSKLTAVANQGKLVFSALVIRRTKSAELTRLELIVVCKVAFL